MEEDSGFSHRGIALKAEVTLLLVVAFGFIDNWYVFQAL